MKAMTPEHLALMIAAEQARAILRHALKCKTTDRQTIAEACNVLTGGLKARAFQNRRKGVSR